jgi:hypothetical protein
MPEFAQQRLDSLRLKVRGEWAHPEALQRENFRANMNATITPNVDLGVTTAFVKSAQRFRQSDASPVSMFAAARSSPALPIQVWVTRTSVHSARRSRLQPLDSSEIFQDLTPKACSGRRFPAAP